MNTDTTIDADALRARVIDALKTVYDPEIPVNIYDLGLIYRCDVDPQGVVELDMTLTAPGCPVAQTFPEPCRRPCWAWTACRPHRWSWSGIPRGARIA